MQPLPVFGAALPGVPQYLSVCLQRSMSRATDTASLDEINLEEKEMFQMGHKLVGGRRTLFYRLVCGLWSYAKAHAADTLSAW